MSKASSSSTALSKCSMPPSLGLGSPMCRRTSRGLILPRAASDGYSVTGARLIPAITSITRAVVNRRRPSPCLSRRSATVRLDQIRIGNLRGASERRTFPNHSFRPPLKTLDDRHGSRAVKLHRVYVLRITPDNGHYRELQQSLHRLRPTGGQWPLPCPPH